MKLAIQALVLAVLLVSARAADTPKDCWFRKTTETPLNALASKDIEVLPTPQFVSVTIAYWEDVGRWTVKLRSAKPLVGDIHHYAIINGHAAYPPLMRQRPNEPTVVAFAFETRETAQSFATGLARLHGIPIESIKSEDKHTWP